MSSFVVSTVYNVVPLQGNWICFTMLGFVSVCRLNHTPISADGGFVSWPFRLGVFRSGLSRADMFVVQNLRVATLGSSKQGALSEIRVCLKLWRMDFLARFWIYSEGLHLLWSSFHLHWICLTIANFGLTIVNFGLAQFWKRWISPGYRFLGAFTPVGHPWSRVMNDFRGVRGSVPLC